MVKSTLHDEPRYQLRHVKSVIWIFDVPALPDPASGILQATPDCMRRLIERDGQRYLCQHYVRRPQETLPKLIRDRQSFPLVAGHASVPLLWLRAQEPDQAELLDLLQNLTLTAREPG